MGRHQDGFVSGPPARRLRAIAPCGAAAAVHGARAAVHGARAAAPAPDSAASAGSLADPSLEEPANLRITSVSRRAERLSDATTSTCVITAEAVRRSGAGPGATLSGADAVNVPHAAAA
jgi:hypothetical protein